MAVLTLRTAVLLITAGLMVFLITNVHYKDMSALKVTYLDGRSLTGSNSDSKAYEIDMAYLSVSPLNHSGLNHSGLNHSGLTASTSAVLKDYTVWINCKLPSSLYAGEERLNITASHSADAQLKKANQFTIDDLIPFYGNFTWRCNSDGTCYENWLAMKFPPNAEWDKNYKTPCYTDPATSIFKCLPHIYLVGWAKSGTTDMWDYLQYHPNILKTYKETQFLTQFSFHNGAKEMKKFEFILYSWFGEQSELQKLYPEKLTLEATATVIYDNWHWRIKQGYQGDENIPTHTNLHYLRKLHPQAQIIVMMRNPVNRALSFFNHGIEMTIKDNENLGFKYHKLPKTPEDIHQFFVESIYYFNECVKKKSLRACCHMPGWSSQDWGDPAIFMTLRIGIYYIYLEEVFKNFPLNQVFIIKSEEFYSQPRPILNDLFTFLNIDANQTDDIIRQKNGKIIMNIQKYITPLPETYRLLQDFYRPFNKRLAYMLGDEKWLSWEA